MRLAQAKGVSGKYSKREGNSYIMSKGQAETLKKYLIEGRDASAVTGELYDLDDMAKGGKLIGKQKNLDVNKNGKLDAEDFKMLRGEKMAKGGESKSSKVNFYDIVDSIKYLEYDGDPSDLRLFSDERFNWGADNPEDYEKAEKEIDNIKYKGNGWEIYATYDGSSYSYWMENQEEQNYISIVILFQKEKIDKSEIEKIKEALQDAHDDAENIADKYYYNPSNYAKGGKTQGYDDREDERLAMKYGRIGSKYLNSTKARRDDARFEERGKMEDGGMMAKGGRAKAEQNVLNKRIGEYYLDTFKTDDLGFKINSKATFGGLLRVLDNGGNIYEYIGVGDSIIRERVFGKLAKLMNVDYDVIYDKWLFGNEMADGGFVVGEAQDVSRYSNYKGKGYPVMKKSVGNNSDFVLFVYKTKEEAEAKAKQLNERGKMEDGGIMAKGGRPLSAINRDRAYESQDELWEQNYKRQTRPKHPKYSK